jgi:copper homeostasis protein (lipoprotein)
MKILAIFSLLLITFSCSSQQKIGDEHSSQNSLDWTGVYAGTIPCADCEGIEMTVRLNADNTYALEQSYIGKSKEIFSETGSFDWLEQDNKIVFAKEKSTRYYFQVMENKLRFLDQSGNIITGDLNELYFLHKQSGITNTYWKLTELNGNAVEMTMEMKREQHIILKSFNSSINGFGGCNVFNGIYELSDDNTLLLGDLGSTKMACPNMELEKEFLQVLKNSKKYKLGKDELHLMDADNKIIASFVAVYL